MAVSAADVKKLRESTGAGMMDAKRALDAADGDFDKAVEALRIAGVIKAADRGERTAANGLVATSGNAMIQLNCETDFVAKNEQMTQLAHDIVALADDQKAGDLEALQTATLSDGRTVADAVSNLSAVMGEKLELAGVSVLDGTVASYMHRRSPGLPPQVGVQVAYTGDGDGAADAAKQVAMQIAAMRPKYLTEADVPADVVESEKRLAEAKAREEGKPDQIIPKIVDGRLKAYFKDVVLLNQASVQDEKQTIAQVLKQAGADVTSYSRFEVGA